MARESLFNLLRTRIDLEAATVVDLFSGTGFISYEFCSRGAVKVTAVEQNLKCANFIRKTAELLEMKMLKVIRADVFRYLKTCEESADIVFADPPYDLTEIEQLPGLVLNSETLRDGGMFILEHGPDRCFSESPDFSEMRKYGKVHFTFFRKQST